MPTAREVKDKFQEYLETLSEAKQSLERQDRQYAADVINVDAACNSHLDNIVHGFNELRIERLDNALNAAKADWSASQFIADMVESDRKNNEKIQKIEQANGTLSAVGQQLDAGLANVMDLAKKGRFVHLLRDKSAEAAKDRKTDDIINLLHKELEHELELRTESLAAIVDYNTQAEMNGDEQITSANFGAYRQSLFWHAWNKFSSDPNIQARKQASRLINYKPAHVLENDLRRYEEVRSAYQEFLICKQQVGDLQNVYDELSMLNDAILGQGHSLRDKIKATLVSNKVFRCTFAEEFGKEGRDIIANHSKSVLLGQLHNNITAQESSIDNAMSDIKKGLRKLDGVSSYNNVRVDLDKITKSIQDGIYNINLYIAQMDDRRNRVKNFQPAHSNSQYDDGMYFNHLLLYVLLANSGSIDMTNHDVTRDLSAQFGDTLPDLAALDIDGFNLNTMSIPGIDIGASVDISSSISSISSSMPSSSDYGGGYDGGASFGGGFDGGGGGGF